LDHGTGSRSQTNAGRAGSRAASADTAYQTLISEKNDPADVVRTTLDGLEAVEREILADQNTIQVKAALSADPSVLYPQTA
jgi:hypothetical protein